MKKQQILWLVGFLLLVLAGYSGTNIISQAQVKPVVSYRVPVLPISSLPHVNSSEAVSLDEVRASAFIVLDAETGMRLAEKNAQTLFFPASATKMMTALVARETFELDQVVTVSSSSLGNGERIFLPVNGSFLVADLLRAALMQSSNAAALTLAHSDPQGYEGFVQKMNAKADQLHLKSTRFDNPVGFDGEYNQSSAWDLAQLGREVIKDDVLKTIVGTTQTQIIEQQSGQKFLLFNTNELLYTNPSIFGIKTGTTELANQVLVTGVTEKGHEVIIVVLDSPDRYADTRILLSWLERNVTWEELN